MFDVEKLHKHIHACVLAQPKWLRAMFDNGQVQFAIDQSGALVLEFTQGLDTKAMDKALKRIEAYLNKHPVPFITWQEIQ